MTSCPEIPAPGDNFNFVPDQLILYGVRLYGEGGKETKNSGFINIAEGAPFVLPATGKPEGTLSLRLTLFRGNKEIENGKAVIAALYGYAYEGHCYRFDRPQIFLFERPTIAGREVKDKDAEGCGFADFKPPYNMWLVRADTPLLELNTTIGSAQQLILDANLPGRRVPNTYDANMRLAHRGRVMGGGQGT